MYNSHNLLKCLPSSEIDYLVLKLQTRLADNKVVIEGGKSCLIRIAVETAVIVS